MNKHALAGKTILVTGANGFIGKHLVKSLLGIEQVQLLLLSRSPMHFSDDSNVRCLNASLNDLTDEFWQQHGISDIHIVFHLAAFTPKSAAEINDYESVFDANLFGTKRLLESLPSSVEKIVFSSTLDVYSATSRDEVLDENSRLMPDGLYAASKLYCERYVALWSESKPCDYAILRYGHIFGPGEEAYAKLIPLTIKNALQGIPLQVYNGGVVKRDFLYVDDAVEATIRAAVYAGSLAPINIVRGESVQLIDVVQMIAKECGSKSTVRMVEKAGLTERSFMFDCRLMRQQLGVWPLVSLKEGLQREILAAQAE